MGVIVIAVGLVGLGLVASLAAMALDHNPQGEYCRYDVSMEEATWRSSGLPCAFTSDFYVVPREEVRTR